MTSYRNDYTLRTPSLCVYIGNTSSIDDQSLIDYCSKFGAVLSCSIDNCPPAKRLFCDFRIVRFGTQQQRESFLCFPQHQIDSLILDVKCYQNLLDNFELLNIERKLFVGPISNPNDINIIIQFYKSIDSTLQHSLSRQQNQVHILIEFSSRQYIRTVIQQQTIPKTIDNQIFTIHPAVHPKEFIQKTISTRNSQCQLRIHGLTEKVTERILIDYFDKRASVLAYHILPNDPTCAIIELEYEKCVQRLLEMPTIRLHGTALSLSRVPTHLASASEDSQTGFYRSNGTDPAFHAAGSSSAISKVTHPSSATLNVPPVSLLPSPSQGINVIPQQQANPFSLDREMPQPPAILSPEISECGWTSPPRTIVKHCPPDNQLPEPALSRSCRTTTNSPCQSMITETDIKPLRNLTNNISRFVEQFQNDVDQIKDEYMVKFTRDRISIEHEFNRLINDERMALERADRYLYEKRPSSGTKLCENRRK